MLNFVYHGLKNLSWKPFVRNIPDSRVMWIRKRGKWTIFNTLIPFLQCCLCFWEKRLWFLNSPWKNTFVALFLFPVTKSCYTVLWLLLLSLATRLGRREKACLPHMAGFPLPIFVWLGRFRNSTQPFTQPLVFGWLGKAEKRKFARSAKKFLPNHTLFLPNHMVG